MDTRFSVLSLLLLVLMPSCTSFNFSDKPAHLDKKKFRVDKLETLEQIIPIAILGSGPAGLSAAIYAARAGFTTIVFEGALPGGLLTQTTLVENWPGSIAIDGPDIIKGLKEQATKWGVTFVQDTVEQVVFTQWPFKLITAEGREINALSVILATGATPRYLGVPGELVYWGKGVTTCAVCDAPFFKDQDVVVVGGGDSAIEEAMQLAPYAKDITIFVRKDAMRASKAMQDRLKEYKQISVTFNMEIKEIQGDEHEVTAIEVYNNKTNKTEIMPIKGIFLAIGHIPNTTFLQNAIDLTDDGHIDLSTRTQQTSVPGVFAAGDVADMRYRQAGVSAGHGIAAALDATFFLNDIGYNHVLEQSLRSHKRLMSHEQTAEYEVQEVNTMDEFKTVVLDSEIPVIVDFYAEWCSSCMQMLPAFAATAQDFNEKVRCIKVDADQAEAIMQTYHVQKVPTLLAFKDGQIVARFAKAMSKAELTELAQKILE